MLLTFKDFAQYMEKVRPWGERSSIVKIIPPQEWVDGVELVGKRALQDLEIRSPIEQRMIGRNGVFVQRNIERNRSRPLSIREWFDKCSQEGFTTANPKEVDRTKNRDSREAKAWLAQKEAERQEKLKIRRQKQEAAAERKRRREAEAAARAAAKDSSNFDRPTASAHHAVDLVKTEVDDVPALTESSSNKSSPEQEPLATTPPETPQQDPEETPLDPFYEETDLHRAWLPEGVEPTDYTVTGCASIERKFWKQIGMSTPSWYGADLPGSLFADPSYPWNVANLPNMLNKLPRKLPGVNSPYLYFGQWKSAFSWHVEDMDLYSINYIHFGAPKFWYAVPQAKAERFESIAKTFFPTDANHCDQFMRHKSCTLSPTMLRDHGIPVNKLVHNQHEFVITFPRGYHAGFNMGFNCAESVNFALPSWLDLGRKAKACTCVNFSVTIDVDYLTGDRPFTPESSDDEGTEEKAPKRRKRERPPPPVEEPSPVKLPIIRIKRPQQIVPLTPEPATKPSVTRELPNYPCILCPSLVADDLARVFEPSEYLQTMTITPEVLAHSSCAVAIPEAYTEDVEVDGIIITYVKGLNDIGKDRWKLKCSACVDKRTAQRGTKIQCTKGKCIRAYHVPCARENPEIHYFAGVKQPASGAVGDAAGEKSEQAGDGEFAVELLCPTHNPAMIQARKRKTEEELYRKVHAVEPGSFIKFKKSGVSYAAELLEIKDNARRAVVRLPDGSVTEVAWTALDFRSHEIKMQENEYAGPPKRSRKDVQTITTTLPASPVSLPRTSAAPSAPGEDTESMTTNRPPALAAAAPPPPTQQHEGHKQAHDLVTTPPSPQARSVEPHARQARPVDSEHPPSDPAGSYGPRPPPEDPVFTSAPIAPRPPTVPAPAPAAPAPAPAARAPQLPSFAPRYIEDYYRTGSTPRFTTNRVNLVDSRFDSGYRAQGYPACPPPPTMAAMPAMPARSGVPPPGPTGPPPPYPHPHRHPHDPYHPHAGHHPSYHPAHNYDYSAHRPLPPPPPHSSHSQPQPYYPSAHPYPPGGGWSR